MCGVWVAVEEEQHLQEVVRELLSKTDLQVPAGAQCQCIQCSVLLSSSPQAVMEDRPVLVVATPTDQSDTLQCYRVKGGSLHPVASSPVADYLSSHTLLLRATSSLSTHLFTSKTTKGAPFLWVLALSP